MVNDGRLEGSINTGGPGSNSPGNDRLTNRGTITDHVFLGYGSNTVTNSGTIGSNDYAAAFYVYTSGGGTNTFTNYEIVGGVKISGVVHGFISFAAGVDRFYGGENAEKVFAGRGNDIVNMAGGDDLFLAEETFSGGVSTSNDTVDGGAGNDTYDAFNLPPGLTSNPVTGGAVINIDTVKHTVGSVLFVEPWASITSPANMAKGESIGTDRVFGFENVIATANDDTVFGNPLANVIYGLDGRDILFGYEGDDTIDGGAENDGLVGGRGRDVLVGGPGGDLFLYSAVQDSGVTAATRDFIADFQDGIDFIYLTAIDANTVNGSAVNDDFVFIGNNVAFAANTPGTLRTVWTATGYLIEGNTDNDIAAEFSIEVYDLSHSIVWTGADFYL
jgi:Ca2+-binding RTX toxin-like protein